MRAPAGKLEVHRNPHKPAQTRGSRQKKTNPMRGWSSCLVVHSHPGLQLAIGAWEYW